MMPRPMTQLFWKTADNHSNEDHVNCIRPGDAGTPAAALFRTLTADYGASFQSIDRGYPVLRTGAGAAGMPVMEGADDGCATYTEVLQAAVSQSTIEAWGGGRPRLFHHLFSEHKLKLPWVVPDPELSAAIIRQVKDIRTAAGASSRLLIDRLYRDMLPLEGFAIFFRNPRDPLAVNPMHGVWKLYAYLRVAELDPRFTLVRRDRDGVGTTHVAVMAHGLLVDPAYNMVGGRHQEVAEISPLQALSCHYVHTATDLKDVNGIMSLLDQALVLDPSNRMAVAYKLLASQEGDDPLRPMRDAMRVRMAAAWR